MVLIIFWIYQHSISKEIDSSIKRYFGIARNCQATKEAFGDRVLDIIGEDFVRDPPKHLRKICDFLEITCTEDYIHDCSSIIDPVPSMTRSFVVWTPEQIKTVYTSMQSIGFLQKQSYNFESWTEWSTNRTTLHLQTSDFHHQSSLFLL